MKRVSFLIDGFNLYHSIVELEDKTGDKCKWLDLEALCKSYVHLFGKDAKLEKVYYFSALAKYLNSRDPNKVKKHKSYIKCLESVGVEVILGRFKKKYFFCSNCRKKSLTHEEKETDVSLAIKILELFFKDECDEVVVVSGDTDLAPPARKALELFKDKKVIFAFPFARKNNELAKIAPKSFSISHNSYKNNQFPDIVELDDGSKVNRPTNW